MAGLTTGRFVWHELHASDRLKGAGFYGKLVGWEIKEFPMGPGETYSLILRGGKDFGGILKSKAPAGVPSHWLPYIAVEDVDAYAGKAKSLGAREIGPPMDIPNAGRFAVIADPQGAVFALYKHASPYPEEPMRTGPGGFCWEELMTHDPEAAAKFYVELLGYGVESRDMGPMGTYRILTRGDRQTAGIVKMPEMIPRANWLSYIAVENVDTSAAQAKDLGAQILVPPTDIPEIGRFSVLSDPTGASIALFTPSA